MTGDTKYLTALRALTLEHSGSIRKESGVKNRDTNVEKNKEANTKRQKEVNRNNLIDIPLINQPKQHESKKKLLTINAGSVKNKDLLIKGHLVDENADICIISESWLQDSDQAWIDGCELNKDGYRLLTAHRKDRVGGGLACVYNDTYKVEQKHAGCRNSFEFAVWHVRLDATNFMNIVGIYHPPPSNKNPPNSVFIDEIAKFMAEEILQLSESTIQRITKLWRLVTHFMPWD
jgi:hypothetical protein